MYPHYHFPQNCNSLIVCTNNNGFIIPVLAYARNLIMNTVKSHSFYEYLVSERDDVKSILI